MEDIETDAPLPANTTKKSAALDKAQYPPETKSQSQSPTLNQSDESSTHRMQPPNVDSKPLVVGDDGSHNDNNINNNDNDNINSAAAVGTKRKMAKDERPPAKKLRASIELENKLEIPISITNTDDTMAIPCDGHEIEHRNGEQVQIFRFEYDGHGYGDVLIGRN